MSLPDGLAAIRSRGVSPATYGLQHASQTGMQVGDQVREHDPIEAGRPACTPGRDGAACAIVM